MSLMERVAMPNPVVSCSYRYTPQHQYWYQPTVACSLLHLPNGQEAQKSISPPAPIRTLSQISDFSIENILRLSSCSTHNGMTLGGGQMTYSGYPESTNTAAKLLLLQQQILQSHTSSESTPSTEGIALYCQNIRKRKLGRSPRIPFAPHQVDMLEKRYLKSKYLSSLDVVALSKQLGLSEPRVKIWFQNRRARERRHKQAQ